MSVVVSHFGGLWGSQLQNDNQVVALRRYVQDGMPVSGIPPV